MNRFGERAVIVGRKIDGALVEFAEQEFGDRRKTRFGIAHRRRAVAVA